jgi:hypothetical protein
VAYALGRELDALSCILGIFGGSFLFGVTVPGIERINVAGAVGSPGLPVWLNLNTARQSPEFKIQDLKFKST